jgi:hypothetical protein
MEKKLQAVNVDTASTDDPNGGNGTAGSQQRGNIDEAMFKEEMRGIKNRRVMLTTQQFLDQVKVRRLPHRPRFA